jgi:hypothetical protein
MGKQPRDPISVRRGLLAVLPLCFLAFQRAPTLREVHSARLSGIVYDSLHGEPLAQAKVVLLGAERQVVTNERGEYAFDDIEPGKYSIEVKHPFLDTLGIRLASSSIDAGSGAPTTVNLSIPSGRHLVDSLCAGVGRGGLVGFVLDAESGKPATGAVVTVKWKSLGAEGGEGEGLDFVSTQEQATVDANGVYRVCGLPHALEGTMQVTRGDVTGGILRVALKSDVIAWRGVRVATPQNLKPGDGPRGKEFGTTGFPSPTPGGATLTGRVTTPKGGPIRGASVLVLGTFTPVRTDEAGQFSLSPLPAGTQTVVVRFPGYMKVEREVDLSEGSSARIDVVLSEQIAEMKVVNVSAEQVVQGLKTVGFELRHRQGQGKYFTPKDFVASTTQDISEFIRFRVPPPRQMTPMLGVDPKIAGRPKNGTCTNWWMDGRRVRRVTSGSIVVQDSTMNEIRDLAGHLNLSQLAGIEVYHGIATPAQYSDSPGCRTVLIWSLDYVGMQGEGKRKSSEKER